MNWLKDNAAAIQALSAVATLVVTSVLVWLTSKYVRLTREQIQHIKEAARVTLQQSATALASLALRLRTGLGEELNSEMPNHRELRTFALLTDKEIADLQALAKDVNSRAVASASAAATHLRVILEMVRTAKGINEAMGWIPTPADTRRWKRAVEGAHRALQEIEAACQSSP